MLAADVRRMLQRLRHRGPDGEAVATHPSGAVGLCRLAISQPDAPAQVFASGNVFAVTNGEIDNHAALRASHRQAVDTAVVPELFAAGGAAGMAQLRGMYACIVHDVTSNKMHLLRDPLGKKPLYYRQVPGRVLVASEQKALFIDDVPRVDVARAARFFVRGFLDDDEPLFAGVQVVPPGGHVCIDDAGITVSIFSRIDDSLSDTCLDLSQLDHLFSQAVQRRHRDDVGCVTLLSGGIDSALVAHAAGVPCATVAVPGRSEADPAALRARRIGLPHACVAAREPSRARARLALRHLEVPDVGGVWEMAPALLDLAEALREGGARVAFTGEGADELFLGYPWQRASWAFSRFMPLPARDKDALALAMSFGMQRMNAPHARAFEHWRRAVQAGTWRASTDAVALLFPSLTSEQLQQAQAPGPRASLASAAPHPERALQLDALTRDMLTLPVLHADRLLMAHGIEARLPFLDEDLVRAALHIPAADLANKLKEKPVVYALAKLRGVPGPARKKIGFSGRARPSDADVNAWMGDGLRQDTRVFAHDALAAFARTAAPSLTWRAILLEETAAVMGGEKGWAA